MIKKKVDVNLTSLPESAESRSFLPSESICPDVCLLSWRFNILEYLKKLKKKMFFVW
jgi:hypothetical protein